MMPSGPPTPMGDQSMPPSLLRSNSGILVGQGGQMPPQAAFSSLVSTRTQYNNGNLLGNNFPSVSTLLNQSFVNGGANSSLSGNVNNPRGGIDAGAEPDPLSGVANAMGFNPPSSSFVPTSLTTAGPPGQVQGHQFSMSSGGQLLLDQQNTQQLETPNYQHGQQQFSATLSNQRQPQPQQPPQQFQSIQGGLPGVSLVKLEPEVLNDQHGPQQQSQQQLQTLRSIGVKMEQQPQLQGMRQPPSVKLEPLHSDQSLPLHLQQQQQQQQLLQMSMSRQSPQAAAAQQINILQQQRILQLQQQQQQQLLKTLPQQRSQVPQQFQQQNTAIRLPTKSAYEAGMCARRLTQYMSRQQHRPDDNNIEFWRKFVSDYFAPNAKKKWCVSLYGSGRQTSGVFPQDAWHCEICNHMPGRGFEATFEVLPRLFKIKYESGTLEELLYVDVPREYHNNSGQIVLDYAKAVQESVFEHLRVVRDGQLRIVFSPDLKICSWEFCARKHEELIPRRLLIPQVSQLGTAAQKYQTATQNTSSSNLSVSDLLNNCNMFVSSARQLAKTLEVPLVNDLGYTKRYVRCLQISEVVNSMKDLIDYSRRTGTGPMESLVKFPRRTSATHGIPGQNQQPDEQQRQQQQSPQHQPPLQRQQSPQQQSMVQNLTNDPSSVEAASMQVVSSNGVRSASNTLNILPASTSGSTIAGLLHQKSMNGRQQNSLSNANSPYCGNPLPSPGGSSSTMQQGQTNPSPFQSPPTPSSSNNPRQTSHNSALVANNHLSSANPLANISGQQQPAFSGDGVANDSQNSMQRVLREMMMSGQLNGGAGGMTGVGSLGNEIKSINGALPQSINTGSVNGASCLMGHGPPGSNSGMVSGGAGFGSGNRGIGQPVMVNGIRTAMSKNPMGMNGRVGLLTRDQSMSHQQQDTGSQLLGGLGSGNGFNNLQFDWKPSP